MTDSNGSSTSGLDRRSFLQYSSSAGLGLVLAPELTGAAPDAKAKAVIQIFLSGGMSHFETFDREILEGKNPTRNVFPHQIAFNLFSHNSPIDTDGFCMEETKMRNETKKIFHDKQVEVVPTTIRVPVYRAHSEAIFVEFEKKMNLKKVYELLHHAAGVQVVDEREKNYFPMPIEAAGKDDVLVGRIREDQTIKNGLALFVSGDQLRKGAALNAIQIAEHWARTQ